jgi:hypothetical protein
MSLPTGEQPSLSQIEKTPADDNPSVLPLLAIFGRLTGPEAMSVTERVTARPWRVRWRMRPDIRRRLGMAMITGGSPVAWPQKLDSSRKIRGTDRMRTWRRSVTGDSSLARR